MRRVDYAAVAKVYADALESRKPVSSRGKPAPIIGVAGSFGVPYETASRWVKEARRKGLLAPPVRQCSGRCGLHCPEAGG